MENSLSLTADRAGDNSTADAKPLTVTQVALGVFLGMWGFAITGGILYGIVQVVTHN
jgi:hypothetical protein